MYVSPDVFVPLVVLVILKPLAVKLHALKLLSSASLKFGYKLKLTALYGFLVESNILQL